MNDRLPFNALLARPLDTLRRAGWLVMLGLTLSLFVPGITKYNLGTFFRDDIIKKLTPDIQAELNEFDSQKLALKNTLKQLDRRILQGTDALAPTELLRLVETREKIEQRIKESKLPYHIATFYPDPLTIVWPLFYIAFLWLIFLLSPAANLGIPIFKRITILIGVFLLYRWPTWLRNTPFLRNLGRKVYAGENFDVDRASFLLQEFQAAIICVLIVGVWLRWSSYFVQWRSDLNAISDDWTSNRARQVGRCLTRQFIHWQACSILLAIAFLPYTYFFWRYVVDLRDQRYLFHAIIVHTMWGISWIFISMPVCLTWYKWQSQQTIESTESVADTKDDESDGKKQNIKVAPISYVNALGSIVVAIYAFISPLFKSIIHV